MCRRYREQGLEEYARNKYESHHWLLSREQEKAILSRFNAEAGKQVTAREIKAALDEACERDTGHMYVYNVLKRMDGGRRCRVPYPKAANEKACEASKKLTSACWKPGGKPQIGQFDWCLRMRQVSGESLSPNAAGVRVENVHVYRAIIYGNTDIPLAR